ncbi:MAG: ankyrin repeat domain-containing protein [Pseudomonadota bacterium]
MTDGIPQDLAAHKKAARRLRKQHAAGDADALSRVSAHVREDRQLRHADFLHVIAREAGQDSWPKLKFAIESRTMSRKEKAERLKVALYFGQHWVTERLLKDDPDLKDDSLGLQVALYDLNSVRRAIAAEQGSATQKIGIRTPILHLAYSQEIHRRPDKSGDMLAIADLLREAGADVDDGYAPEPEGDYKLSALYGAMCHADNFELGKWLLEHGANPNDDESLYHSTELGHTRALALLLKHGAKPDGTNALPRALDFDSVEMVRMLLEAGADPNLTVPDHPSGQPMNTIPSLHQAARRGGSVEVVELLLKFGADPNALWDGHTAHAMARIYGNEAVADDLAGKGFAAALDSNEAILSACASGADVPGLLDATSLSEEDRGLLTRLAFIPGKLDHMKRLVSAGLDPDVPDSMGLPPLHVAGWNGLVEEMAFFLTLQPDLTRKNDYGGDALDTVIHGSEFAPKRPEADHLSCARLLLEAGSVLYPDFISGCGNEDMVQFLEDWRDAH